MRINEEIRELFDLAILKIGGGIRSVEIKDEALCACLKIAMGNYSERVQFFIMDSNWSNMYGKELSNIDLAWSLSVRTLDMTKEFSYYFSKQVGLQNSGPWELKKDYFELEKGRQVYVVPAGRQINKVLWIAPSTVDPAIMGYGMGVGAGFGNGVWGQTGLSSIAAFNGTAGLGMGVGLWALPSYDIALYAADMKTKRGMLFGDMSYKVTAGPDGTHLIHLIDGGERFKKMGGFMGLHGCYCWYTYYDTTNDNIDECRRDNYDVLISPDQVPLKELDYTLLNNATKQIVRSLFIAEVMETVGFVRGKFSGSINFISSPLTMDYNMLITAAQREKENAIKALDERLLNLSPYKQMEKQAQLAKDLLEIQKRTPLGIYVK